MTHTVSNGGVLKSSILAKATKKTPILLSQHVYWNLDAYQGSDTILNHKLRIDASRVIAVDDHLIPTGEFTDVEGTALDFRKPQAVGARWNGTVGLCGPSALSWPFSAKLCNSWYIALACQGYDNAWIYDRDVSKKSGFSLWSDLSGIRCAPHPIPAFLAVL